MRRVVIVWPSLSTMTSSLRMRLAEHGLTLDEVEPDISPDVVARIVDMGCDVVLVADWTPGQPGYGFREFARDLVHQWASADPERRLLAVISQQPAGAELYNWLASRGVYNIATAAGKERIGIEDLVRLMTQRFRPTDPAVLALIDPAYAESLKQAPAEGIRREPAAANGTGPAGVSAPGKGRIVAIRKLAQKASASPAPAQDAAGRKPVPPPSRRQEPADAAPASDDSPKVGNRPAHPAGRQATKEASVAGTTEGVRPASPYGQRGSGRIYVVAGYKGGVGRTTAAASIAALLAGQGLRVAAGDLHWEMPTLGAHFGLESVAAGPGWEAICTGYVPKDLPSRWGVTVIAAPNGYTCQVDDLRAGLRRLTQEFDAIVLDVGPSPWDTAFRAAAVEADRIVVMTSNDPITVEANTRLVELLAAELGVQMVRVLAAGMAWRDQAGGVPVDLVREALGAPATVWAGVVPSDPTSAMQALAGGTPMGLVAPAAWEPLIQALTGQSGRKTDRAAQAAIGG
ncbi:nucleotide-binding protein [Thermaerobacter litoralis]